MVCFAKDSGVGAVVKRLEDLHDLALESAMAALCERLLQSEQPGLGGLG